MDDRLFDIFSDESSIPAIVTDRIDSTLLSLEEENKLHSEKTISFTGRKKSKWKGLLALTAAIAIMSVSVYAAEKYWGISDFLRKYDTELSAEQQSLVDTNVELISKGDSIVDYTIKEAVCDGKSVQVVIEVTAKERGKYLLAPTDALATDSVANLGWDGDSTIGEYAESKDLEIAYVGISCSLISHQEVEFASQDFQNIEDDVIDIFVSSRITESGLNTDENLAVTCTGSVRPSDAETHDDIYTTDLQFQLQNKTNSQTATYALATSEDEPDKTTTAGNTSIKSVTIESTDLANYATIVLTVNDAADPLDVNLCDEDGATWQAMDIIQQESSDSEHTVTEIITYPKQDLPDKLYLQIYDWDNDTYYDPVEFKLTE